MSAVAISDGAGGAIIAWAYTSGDGGDIYAQRIDGSGNLLWTAAGVPLCTAVDWQSDPTILSDNAGGAIVAWSDLRDGVSDIYAQRVDGAGAVQWTADGVAVSTAASNQYFPQMTTDGANGALVVWWDYRPLAPPNSGPNLFGTRLTSAGLVVDGAATGIAMAVAPNAQQHPVLVPKGIGGAIIAWGDYRNNMTTGGDIYAIRTNNFFAPIDVVALAICQSAGTQDRPAIISDGAGGAIIAWPDNRVASGIYAQRMASNGVVQWTANGVQLGFNPAPVLHPPQMLPDGAGGVIASWWAGNSPDENIYAQRLNASGVRQWLPNDVVVCDASNEQRYPSIAPDNAGGMVVSWQDRRSGVLNDDVYAQRINASGVTQWTGNGVLVSGADLIQEVPALASDGAGGVIVAWTDWRAGLVETEKKIYAQRVWADGQVPTAIGDTPSAATLSLMVHPNPFSKSTALQFQLHTTSDVSVDVYDVAGRRVRGVTIRDVPAGAHRIAVDDRDDDGRVLPSGVYFCRVTAAGVSETKKLIVLR